MTDPDEPKRDDAPFLTRWAQRKQTAQRAPQSGAETKKAADDAPPPDGRVDAEAADGEPEFDPATLPNVTQSSSAPTGASTANPTGGFAA